MTETTRVFLTSREVEKLLGVSRRTVDNIYYRKELPKYHVGRSVRYDLADVNAYLDRKRTVHS